MPTLKTNEQSWVMVHCVIQVANVYLHLHSECEASTKSDVKNREEC